MNIGMSMFFAVATVILLWAGWYPENFGAWLRKIKNGYDDHA